MTGKENETRYGEEAGVRAAAQPHPPARETLRPPRRSGPAAAAQTAEARGLRGGGEPARAAGEAAETGRRGRGRRWGRERRRRAGGPGWKFSRGGFGAPSPRPAARGPREEQGGQGERPGRCGGLRAGGAWGAGEADVSAPHRPAGGSNPAQTRCFVVDCVKRRKLGEYKKRVCYCHSRGLS